MKGWAVVVGEVSLLSAGAVSTLLMGTSYSCNLAGRVCDEIGVVAWAVL